MVLLIHSEATRGAIMTITAPLADPALARRIIDAEVAIITHVRANALQDPFWESITVDYASEEVTVRVVNLVDYAEDARSGESFSPALVHEVRHHIAFLHAHARSTASVRAPRPHVPSLTVYRDGDTARERMPEGRPTP
jgi:hypothetical protein